MTIDGVEATTVNITETEVNFKVNGMRARTSPNLELYFEEGLPKGYDEWIESKSLYAGFRMTGIEPAFGSGSVGSMGGTKLTITAPCYGEDVDLTDVTVQSKHSNPDYDDICRDLQFIEYGKLSCITLPGVEVTQWHIIRLFNPL